MDPGWMKPWITLTVSCLIELKRGLMRCDQELPIIGNLASSPDHCWPIAGSCRVLSQQLNIQLMTWLMKCSINCADCIHCWHLVTYKLPNMASDQQPDMTEKPLNTNKMLWVRKPKLSPQTKLQVKQGINYMWGMNTFFTQFMRVIVSFKPFY